MRVTLADAGRMTERRETTIRRWIARGVLEPGAEMRCDAHAESRRGGGGWSIDVTALEQAHRAHGGIYWHPEVAERVRLPDYLARRLALVEHLEDEVARLHRLVDALQLRQGRTDKDQP